MIRITWKLPQSFDLSYHSFAAVLGIPVHCKHWYHLSTLRVSGQARITFGENEVPFSDRCAEAGRPDSWTVRSEIIWCDFPKRSAYNVRNMQKKLSLDYFRWSIWWKSHIPAWSEEIHAPLSIQESFLGTNLLTLTYFFFSMYPWMYWIIRDSQNWVTAEAFIHYIAIARLSLYSSQCEYQSWNYRQQCTQSVVLRSGCSFNWKIRSIPLTSQINQKLQCLWMLDGHFSPASTKLQLQNA